LGSRRPQQHVEESYLHRKLLRKCAAVAAAAAGAPRRFLRLLVQDPPLEAVERPTSVVFVPDPLVAPAARAALFEACGLGPALRSAGFPTWCVALLRGTGRSSGRPAGLVVCAVLLYRGAWGVRLRARVRRGLGVASSRMWVDAGPDAAVLPPSVSRVCALWGGGGDAWKCLCAESVRWSLTMRTPQLLTAC
jgi:hypothetical protein